MNNSFNDTHFGSTDNATENLQTNQVLHSYKYVAFNLAL